MREMVRIQNGAATTSRSFLFNEHRRGGMFGGKHILLVLLFGILLVGSSGTTAAAEQTIYYVDCVEGDDAYSGISPEQAWRSLDRANDVLLEPGDRLLLKRGCTWLGTLHARWHGTETAPVLISAYGEGQLPKIRNHPEDVADHYHNNVDITGAYQIIEHIETEIVDPPVESDCQNNPVGFYVGFNFRNPNNRKNGGSYNVLRSVKATKHTAGVHLNSVTHHNRILESIFVDNHVMEVLTPKPNPPSPEDPGDDIGAWGMVVRGSDHEIAYNFFSNNYAQCTYDTPRQGNAVELYEARNVTIHHNVSINDRHFSEIGGSEAIKSHHNRYVYNVVVSSVEDARFIISRGDGSRHGPTTQTLLYHNTVYFTGSKSEAVVCGAGCSPEILTAKNNIFWAEEKVMFADAPFDEGHNIYWSSNGQPFIQFMGFAPDSTSQVMDPQFVGAEHGDFRLLANSPAIDSGMSFWWGKDIAGISLPQNGLFDIGAHEYFSISSYKYCTNCDSTSVQRSRVATGRSGDNP